MTFTGADEGPVNGSLLIDPTDTKITFVATTLLAGPGDGGATPNGLPLPGTAYPDSPDATPPASGVLVPDSYTLDLASAAFTTTSGQVLDGSGTGTRAAEMITSPSR